MLSTTQLYHSCMYQDKIWSCLNFAKTLVLQCSCSRQSASQPDLDSIHDVMYISMCKQRQLNCKRSSCFLPCELVLDVVNMVKDHVPSFLAMPAAIGMFPSQAAPALCSWVRCVTVHSHRIVMSACCSSNAQACRSQGPAIAEKLLPFCLLFC